jgi:hypothetical protein
MEDETLLYRATIAPFSKFIRDNPKLTLSEAYYKFLDEKCGMNDKEIAKESGRALSTIRNTKLNASGKNP